MDELNRRGLLDSHFYGATEFNVVDLFVLLPQRFPRRSQLEGATRRSLTVFDCAFPFLVVASDVSAGERALFLLKASPSGVERELSESNKTARSVTLVGDLVPTNASISICVGGLSEEPILGRGEATKLGSSMQIWW